jgi:tetratricopeptide (TPR) repeat protein
MQLQERMKPRFPNSSRRFTKNQEKKSTNKQATEMAEKHSKSNDIPTSKDRANEFYERAKQLALLSSGSSIEMERILKEIYRALSFESEEILYHLLAGRIYRQCLDLTSALFCYRYILKIDNSNIAARKGLAEILALKGKEYIIKGNEMKSKSKYIAARSCFDEALEFFRENNELWILKAICHVHCEEFGEAYEAISKVIKPSHVIPAEIFILRAKINWARGLVEQGNQDMRAAASIEPTHPEVIGYINRSYAKSEKLYRESLQKFTQKQYKEALEHVEHALYITNDDVKLHLMKAKIHRVSNNLQLAYDAVLKAKEIFIQSYNVEQDFAMNLPHEIQHQINLILNDMALQYAFDGDYERAILLFNRIIREEEDTSNQLHTIQLQLQKTSTSIKIEQPDDNNNNNSPRNGRGIAAAPVGAIDHKYYVNRGDCYRALHQLSDAVIDYQMALNIAPKDWSILTKLSLTYYLMATDDFNQSRFREAEIALTKSIDCNNKVSQYFALRGKTRYYLGNCVEAYQDYKKALELNPEDREIQLRIKQFESNFEEDKQTSTAVTKGNHQKHRNIKQVQQPSKQKVEEKPLGGAATLSALPTTHNNISKKSMKIKSAITTEEFDSARHSTYLNERTIVPVQLAEEDFIQMMLHPQQAVKLPTLKLLTTEDQLTNSMKSKKIIPLTEKSIENFPHIARFQKAHEASKLVSKKAEITKQLFDQREDLNRSVTWSILKNAMVNVKQNPHMGSG